MRLARLFLLALFPAALLAEPAGLTALKPLYPQTPLVSEGQARCVIVAPGSLSNEAESLASAIARRTGVRPELIADTTLVSAWWEIDFDRLAGRHVLALGNVNSNRLLGRLWGEDYVVEDDAFPGAGGWTVRTVHDPFARGLNVIVLAADAPVGVRQAAQALLADHVQSGERRLSVPGPVLQVKRGAAPTHYADNPAGSARVSNPRDAINFPSPEEFAKNLGSRVRDQVSVVQDEAGARVATLTNLTNVLGQLARAWCYTGDAGYPPLMKRLVDEHRDLLAIIPQRVEMEPASAAAMAWWDLVEELPVWTDEDRLALTNAFLRDARQGHEHTPAHQLVKEGVVQVLTENHGTNSALNTFEHWRYFAKYYDLAEEAYWLSVVQAVFNGQIASHQIIEDSSVYTPFSPEDAALYALRSRDLRFFQLGIARTQMEFLLQVCISNLGLGTGFGDSRMLQYPWAYQPVALIGWWERDPRVAWWLRTYLPSLGLRMWSPRVPLDLSVTGREPVEWTGLSVFPIYRQALGPAKTSRTFVTTPKEPVDGWFNKIVFRERWSPEAQYLLLDGAGVYGAVEGAPPGPAGHNHHDINTIITFTDAGRMWLVDHTYASRAIQEHSGLAITRDGRMNYTNRPARLDRTAQGGAFAMSRTTSTGFADADWERTIFWHQGEHFLVLDRAIARTAGDFMVRCSFKGLGTVVKSGAELRLEQAGRHFQIVADGGASYSLEHEGFPNAEAWSVYPHAEPIARIHEQFKSAPLAAGGELRFANLLKADGSAAALDGAQVRLAGNDAVLVASGGQETLYGLTRLPGGSGASDGYLWAENGFLFAGLRRLGAEGEPWLLASEPVDLWSDEQGKVRVRCTTATRITVDGQAREFAAGEHELAGRLDRLVSLRGVVLAAARMAAAEATRKAAAETGAAPVLPVTKTVALDAGATRMLSVDLAGTGETTWLVSGPAGLGAYATDGKLRWRFAPGTGCGALAAADVDGDGRLEIVVGAADQKVYLLDASGKVRWDYACKASHFSDPPVPDDIRIEDLDGDGVVEIVVAANWIHVLKPDGSLRWEDYWRYQRGRYVGDVQSIDLADINGDGRRDIVCGIRLNYPIALAYDADGKRIYPQVPQAQPSHQPLRVDPPNDTLVLNLFADDGPPQIVVAGSSNLNLRWIGGDRDTKRAGDIAGGRIALATAVPAPGARPLLFTATDMGAIFAYRAKGARGDGPAIDLNTEWVRIVGEKITALETVGTAAGPQVWIGTQSGRVHVFAATTGAPIGATTATGSPVAHLTQSERTVQVVHADGLVQEVKPNALP